MHMDKPKLLDSQIGVLCGLHRVVQVCVWAITVGIQPCDCSWSCIRPNCKPINHESRYPFSLIQDYYVLRNLQSNILLSILFRLLTLNLHLSAPFHPSRTSDV